MSSEIVVRTVRESRDLSPAKWKEILKVSCSFTIMWESLCWDLHESHILRLESEYNREKLSLIYEPLLECLRISTRLAEILDLDLFEFSCSEYEVLWCDLIAERFTTLSDSEWDFFPGTACNIREVHEYSLSGLWTEIDEFSFTINYSLSSR